MVFCCGVSRFGISGLRDPRFRVFWSHFDCIRICFHGYCSTYGRGSSALQYDITDDGRVTGIRFAGGCPGNLEAVARLAEGLPAEAVISRLEGIQCGSKPTSCPDQLARALKRELAARGA